MTQIHSFINGAFVAFLLTTASGSAFMLSSDFSQDTPGGPPAGAELFDLNEGRIIKVVDANSEPEDPFDVKGNKSLLFEKNEEGVGAIARAEWGNIPDIDQGKLAFTSLSVKEAAGLFDNPVFFAHLFSKGKVVLGAGFGGDSVIVTDGSERVIVRGAWSHNVPNKIEVMFSSATQTFSVLVNGEKLKSQDGKEEFRFQNAPASGGVDKLRFSVAEIGNQRTRVFLDSFELADGSAK